MIDIKRPAKEENISYIEEKHAKMIENYKKLREEIGEWLEASGNAKNINS